MKSFLTTALIAFAPLWALSQSLVDTDETTFVDSTAIVIEPTVNIDNEDATDNIATSETDVEVTDTVQAAPTSVNAAPAPQLKLDTTYVPHHGADFRFFKSVTNPNAKPYSFLDDQTWVGIPIFFAGLIAKGEKTAFRQDYNNNNTRIRLMKYNFHNEIDNITQFVPLFLTVGLKMGGYEGRSDWPRLFASGAMSYAFMALMVNTIKYTASEMRPDGSTRNSWPSGHTATAFSAATILHKEYGLTRSPWFSVGGYALATATGVMRVLNNRHWISDVLSGAGIGILSTELAYGVCDLLFKQRGLLRNDMSVYPDLRQNPSFFNISMGVGIGNRNLTMPKFTYDIPEENLNEEAVEEQQPLELQFRAATAVGVEGAWFFCPYVGIGGRFRVKATPINGWNSFAKQEGDELNKFMQDPDLVNSMQSIVLTVESDHITEFAADAGIYFSYPLSSRFALGSKLLVGRSIMDDIEVRGDYEGDELIYNPTPTSEDDFFIPSGKKVSTSWPYINVSASNSMKFGTGISLTYAHKNAFSWRVFCDYDYCRKTFTASYSPMYFFQTMSPEFYDDIVSETNFDPSKPVYSALRKSLHQWVFGAALCVSF